MLRGYICSDRRKKLLLTLLLAFFIVHCSDNDDQRQFEREAMRAPDGITETDGSGALTGDQDPDDWRIAPFFQGLVEIDPAFPNPVMTNENVEIHIEITGIESVMGIEAVWIDEPYFHILDEVEQAPLPPGLTVLRFPASRMGTTTNPESALGLKRVLIFDRNRNIISYGDIRVE